MAAIDEGQALSETLRRILETVDKQSLDRKVNRCKEHRECVSPSKRRQPVEGNARAKQHYHKACNVVGSAGQSLSDDSKKTLRHRKPVARLCRYEGWTCVNRLDIAVESDSIAVGSCWTPHAVESRETCQVFVLTSILTRICLPSTNAKIWECRSARMPNTPKKVPWNARVIPPRVTSFCSH